MRVTYSTNAWGKIYAHCGATNNVNMAFYVTDGDVDAAFRDIAASGYESVEMLDGDLLPYENDLEQLEALLKKYRLTLKGVYSACCFIYDEILEEEFSRLKRTAAIAKKLGATQLILGGGAVRYNGIQESDYAKLGIGLDRAMDMAEAMGMTASFHPHIGSLVETPEQLDKVMAVSKIALCPDCGHIYLGGGDPYEITAKYIDRIKYFHLKGVESDGTFCNLTRGAICFDPIMELLKEHPEIELAVEDDGTKMDPAEDARVTAAYLQKWL